MQRRACPRRGSGPRRSGGCRARAGLALLLCLGCAPPTLAVEVAGAGEVGFLVWSKADRSLAAARFTLPAELPFAWLEGDAQAHLFGLTRAELAQAARGLDQDRLDELALLFEAEPARPAATADGTRLRLAIPPSARWFQLEGDGWAASPRPTLAAELTLRAPISPEACAPAGRRDLRPYPAPLFADAGPSDERDLLRVLGFADGRSVVMTQRALYLLPPDRAPGPRPVGAAVPGDRLMASPAGLQSSWFTEMRRAGVDPRGHPRITVVGVAQEQGRVWDLVLEPEGLRLAGSATTGVILEALAVGPGGEQLLADWEGQVYLRPTGGAPPRRLPPLPVGPEGERAAARALWTGQVDTPWLVSSPGALNLWHAALERWETQLFTLEQLDEAQQAGFTDAYVRFDALAARTTTAGLELWAGGTRGLLVRRIGAGPFLPFPLVPPPRFTPCSVDGLPYPVTRMTQHIDDMALEGEHLYFTIRACTAMFGLHPRTGCSWLLAHPAGASASAVDLQALDLAGGRLLLGGEEGELYRAAP